MAVRYIRERDGNVRARYVGQPRRGSPSRLTTDDGDLRLAIRELESAHEMLAAAARETDPRERREQHRTALGKVLLAHRFVEEILSRPAP
jgi:hypothetical protein